MVDEAMHKAQALEKAESKLLKEAGKAKEGAISPAKPSEESLTIANYNEALLIPH
jgi:hypothetical protein